jgi:hypothetical protein
VTSPSMWSFDHKDEAEDAAGRLNAGEKVQRSDYPLRRSYEAGWGLKYEACGGMGGTRGWKVYGRGR